MNKKQKDFSLRVLAMLLPYDVSVEITLVDGTKFIDKLSADRWNDWNSDNGETYEGIRPFLRPTASMTLDEKNDLLLTVVGKDGAEHFHVTSTGIYDNDKKEQSIENFSFHWINFENDSIMKYVRWMLEHKFDMFGMVKKKLAISDRK